MCALAVVILLFQVVGARLTCGAHRVCIAFSTAVMHGVSPNVFAAFLSKNAHFMPKSWAKLHAAPGFPDRLDNKFFQWLCEQHDAHFGLSKRNHSSRVCTAYVMPELTWAHLKTVAAAFTKQVATQSRLQSAGKPNAAHRQLSE